MQQGFQLERTDPPTKKVVRDRSDVVEALHHAALGLPFAAVVSILRAVVTASSSSALYATVAGGHVPFQAGPGINIRHGGRLFVRARAGKRCCAVVVSFCRLWFGTTTTTRPRQCRRGRAPARPDADDRRPPCPALRTRVVKKVGRQQDRRVIGRCCCCCRQVGWKLLSRDGTRRHPRVGAGRRGSVKNVRSLLTRVLGS